MSEWIDVAATAEFGPGQGKLVDADDVQIAVFNLDGEYYAIEDTCTHDGSPMLGCGLSVDELLDGDEIICPRHGARFAIKTGDALTPPAYDPVPIFPVRVKDGVVQVRDDRWD
jgi:3-phenylpropionate/trans-cinnamate dioxygenase ferredoxin component